MPEPRNEADIERYLVKQAKLRGAEVRKVAWPGRRGAPDRVLMLPGGRVVWVELKSPGLAATFPSNAHERQQDREHRRMRRAGQSVYVADSYAGVNRVFE